MLQKSCQNNVIYDFKIKYTVLSEAQNIRVSKFFIQRIDVYLR